MDRRTAAVTAPYAVVQAGPLKSAEIIEPSILSAPFASQVPARDPTAPLTYEGCRSASCRSYSNT